MEPIEQRSTNTCLYDSEYFELQRRIWPYAAASLYLGPVLLSVPQLYTICEHCIYSVTARSQRHQYRSRWKVRSKSYWAPRIFLARIVLMPRAYQPITSHYRYDKRSWSNFQFERRAKLEKTSSITDRGPHYEPTYSGTKIQPQSPHVDDATSRYLKQYRSAQRSHESKSLINFSSEQVTDCVLNHHIKQEQASGAIGIRVHLRIEPTTDDGQGIMWPFDS